MTEAYFAHKTCCVDAGCVIGRGTKIWHFSHIMTGCVLGERCNIGQNVVISPGVTIGSGVKVQNNVSIYEGVELEDYVFCGLSMVFTNDLTPRAKYPKGNIGYKKTVLKEGATVGANATIVCGHTVGKWAMIAAGAVITMDVPDYALMAGVPAKEIGYVCECGERLGESLVCESCKRVYKYNNEKKLGLREVT